MHPQSTMPQGSDQAMALRRRLFGEAEALRQKALLRIPRAAAKPERRGADRRKGDRRQD